MSDEGPHAEFERPPARPEDRVIFVRVPAELHHKIAEAAKADDSSISRFVRQVLRRAIERRDEDALG